MKRVLSALIFVFCLSVTLQIGASVAFSAAPVLFFSDLTWGPKTGWEGSSTKGAAVTVWGKNFGSPRGSSYITVNGAQLINDSDYAEWDAIGPARALERITFWLNSTCQDGNGSISVTVGGVTSNTLPFNITTGTIYFISVSDGNNTYNGKFSTRTGHSGSEGPFKDLYMFNPGIDSFSYGQNPSKDGQYIVYVKGGTYTALDTDGAFVALRGAYGGPTKQKALIAYPGETPSLNATSADRGVIWNANYSPYGRNSDFCYSKLSVTGGGAAIDFWGDNNRVIGCQFNYMQEEVWSGVVMVDNSYNSRIYGNLFDNCGYDSYKHNIYIKTHSDYITGDKSCEYTYVGWNEISNAYTRDGRGGAIFISKASDADSKYTRYIWIHGNYFHDGNMEFIYTGDNTPLSDIYIYNNIFRSGNLSMNGAVFLAWDTQSVYLYNNTFYQTSASVPMVYAVGTHETTNAFLKNNIFYANPGQTILFAEDNSTINSDHDLFYGSTAPTSGGGITITNPIVGKDPLFMGPTSYNFHLQSGSPVFNAGTSVVSAYVTQDYDGISRPQVALYDIGAYEYASGGDITPPAKPTKLRVMP
jgi:hypothetical protein